MSATSTPAVVENPTVIDLNKIPQDQFDKVKALVRTEIEPKIREEIQAASTLEISKFKDEYRQTSDEVIRKHMIDWEEAERKKRTPLTPEQLQKLVNKDYVTFTVKLMIPEGDTEVEKDFILRELPQSIERKFYTIAKRTMEKMAPQLAGLDFKDAQGDILTKILDLVEIYEPVQDIMSECCVICLNPRGKLDFLTDAWVKDNLTNYRIMTILMAQMEVNKMRDFFSLLFQGFTSGMKESVGALQ